MPTHSKSKPHSDESKAKMRAIKIQMGLANQESFKIKIRKLMQELSDEVAANDRKYPHNNGKLTVVELAHRAGIHELTLYKSRYSSFRKEEIEPWLKAIFPSTNFPTARSRRTKAEVSEDWRSLYKDLEDSHRVLGQSHELLEDDLRESRSHTADLERDLRTAREQITDLESQLASLRRAIANSGKSIVRPINRN